jgi:hypothetical protein
MKKFYFLFWGILLYLPIKNFAQCNYGSLQPLVIGQVVADTAFCPSGGAITINNVTGGGGYYVYEIIAGPVIRIVQSQNTFNALPAGTYTVRVTSCNGKVRDINTFIPNRYTPISVYNWQQTVERMSGLTCGNTSNGVYKLKLPGYPGGTAPYRVQFSSSASFSSSPYLPIADSLIFSTLNQSSTYYIRITDACNNFQTFNFLTPAATPTVPLSVPALSFTRAYWPGSCSGNETMLISVLDSATGSGYNVNNLYSNKVFWGNKALPYLRMRIEGISNSVVYADRHVSISQYSGNMYAVSTNYSYTGETGLAAPGFGYAIGGASPSGVNVIPQMYPTSEFPAGTPLRITIYFPGGDHCGTAIDPYSKTFTFNIGAQSVTPLDITAAAPNCASGVGNYFRVDFNRTGLSGKLTLVDPAPDYKVLKTANVYSGSNSFATIYYDPLIVGNNYRLILEDTCSGKDSIDVLYNPGIVTVPQPAITDSVLTGFKCPSSPHDTVNTILIKPLPSGYNLISASISGVGAVTNTSIPNWNNSGGIAYKLNKLLPPGNYNYKIVWLHSCTIDSLTQNITIPPNTMPPMYQAALSLSTFTSTLSCSSDGYMSIQIGGYLKNINTNYYLANLRITAVPNNMVFPLKQVGGAAVNALNSSLYYYSYLSADTLKIDSVYSGIIIKTGQGGTYSFSIDIRCPDGSVITTISRSINLTVVVPNAASMPSLQYANALVCDNTGTQAIINMLPTGGTRPFYYEYKLASDNVYTPSGNGGTDSAVFLSPVPAPGTIYDLRVVDACGKSATGKVSVASFTGAFYIYQYPPDCVNSPFDTRVGTSSINGAYYTWMRNGNIIGQGYNMTEVNITGITQDSITVHVDIAGCMSRTASRIVVFTNPCGYVVLAPKNLHLLAQLGADNKATLKWQQDFDVNNSLFEIEKSTDRINFYGIATVSVIPTSGYSFTDLFYGGVIYYRVKLRSKSGAVIYSNIVQLKEAINSTSMQISPNPAAGGVVILKFGVKNKQVSNAKIYDASGRLVKETTLTADELITGKVLDISMFDTGNYVVVITGGTATRIVAKFVKM